MRHFSAYKFFILAALTTTTVPALANSNYMLATGAGGQVGNNQKYCYAYNGEYLTSLVIIQCNCSHDNCTNTAMSNPCPQFYDSSLESTGCMLYDNSGDNLYCVPAASSYYPCSFCGTTSDSIKTTSDWKTDSTSPNRVYKDAKWYSFFNSQDGERYKCVAQDEGDKYYGCASGYYGRNSANHWDMECVRCPSSDGGTTYGSNATGTTDIKTCNVKSGDPFTNDTVGGNGSGNYTGICYYK